MGRRYKKYYSRNYRSKRNYHTKHKNSRHSLRAMIAEFVALLLGLLLMIAFLTKNGWLWGLLVVLAFCVPVVWIVRKYRKSAYYQITKNSYLSVLLDKGKYGEYLTYKYLKHLEADGAKFLFNTYIPKGNEGTTEIDVLMICKKGIFVFESKNYSGWIFGSEQQLYWYQTLPSGRKSRKQQFYNPIMQNKTHIKFLGTLLGEDVPMYSMIVFSERCTLKNVQVQSEGIRVINRQQVKTTVSEIIQFHQNDLLEEKQVVEIYNLLYPYTQVDQKTKEKHIENIQNVQVHKETVSAVETPVQNEPAVAAEDVGNMTTAIEAEKADIDVVPNQIDEVIKVMVQPSICPLCKGELALRTARKGTNAGKQFYGCSNFPKCRYMRDITDTNT